MRGIKGPLINFWHFYLIAGWVVTPLMLADAFWIIKTQSVLSRSSFIGVFLLSLAFRVTITCMWIILGNGQYEIKISLVKKQADKSDAAKSDENHHNP